MIAIQIMARPGWGLYRRGKQIAYHLSIEMNVSVKIDTVTLTVCGRIKNHCQNAKPRQSIRIIDGERNLISFS